MVVTFPPIGKWKQDGIGKKIVKLTLEDKYIETKGVDRLVEIPISEGHRLVRLELKHTTIAKVDSTDELIITLSRRSTLSNETFIGHTIRKISTKKPDAVLGFGEGWEYSSGVYVLTLNSTDTDRVYPEMYIQLLE